MNILEINLLKNGIKYIDSSMKLKWVVKDKELFNEEMRVFFTDFYTLYGIQRITFEEVKE